MKPEAREKLESMLKNMAEEETKYGTEKKEIEIEAKKLEHERDVNGVKTHTSTMGKCCFRSPL